MAQTHFMIDFWICRDGGYPLSLMHAKKVAIYDATHADEKEIDRILFINTTFHHRRWTYRKVHSPGNEFDGPPPGLL